MGQGVLSSLEFREQNIVLDVNVLGQILGQFGKAGVSRAKLS
jgi:hypothetical protein